MRNRIICLCLLAGLLWIGVPVAAHAADCLALFQKSRFVSAARCMEKKAKSLSKKEEKGRWLRNAIKAWSRAADTTKDLARSAFMRERAIALINRHNRNKLYEDADQRNSLRREARRLYRAIGHASLIVVSNHPRGYICVKGYSFKKCNTQSMWSLKVRPGKYDISVRYPLNPPVTQSGSVVLDKKAQQAKLFNPPYGTASIVSNDPKALIEINSSALGEPMKRRTALWSLPLPPGEYKLKVKYPHHPIKERSFQVERGKTVVVTMVKPPALPMLRVDTQPPQAFVLIDGKVLGKSKLRLPVQAGKHAVALRKSCYLPVKRTVTTKSNRTNAISVTLKRDPAYLSWEGRKKNEGTFQVLGWVGVGLGIASAAASFGLHLGASSLHSSAVTALTENRVSGFDTFKQQGEEGNLLRTLGYVTMGVGVAGLVVGMVSLLSASPGPLSAVPCQIRTKDLAKKLPKKTNDNL